MSSPDKMPTGVDPSTSSVLPPVKPAAGHSISRKRPSENKRGRIQTGKPLPALPKLYQDAAQDARTAPTVHGLNNATAPGGAFSNSHHFVIHNANMHHGGRTDEERREDQERRRREERRIEEEREAEEERQAENALKELAAKGMPGAMLDSKDRGYVPRCNEDTRQAVRSRIVQWGRRIQGSHPLLWLSGPAGVGKSAIAQTVAEELKKEGLLGAVFFFSRPNNRSDPDLVIPTLVYQLALHFPEYQRIVTRKLVKDPLVLNRNRRSQFWELIISPFLSLTSQLQTIVQTTFLIILDGLDECNDREAQREFVEMIGHHAQLEGAGLRLRWMICSRPEPDLKVIFASSTCKAVCVHEKLEVDDNEAQKDARRILDRGFAEIRQRYPDQVTEDWPTKAQILFIASSASGHLGFAAFIIRFIGDKDYDDPSGQLEICLRFLERTGGSEDANPLLALDLLYTRILSDIPANILPTTQRILGLFILYNNRHLTVAAHANFLGLTQASFYRALRHLHSVVSVPPTSEAGESPIQTYHASFPDYLLDKTRSGKFSLDGDPVHVGVAFRGLQWLNYGHKNPSRRMVPDLTWIPPNTTRSVVLASLCKFSFAPCWKACSRVPKDYEATLIEVLEKFDFNLDFVRWWEHETKDFAYFIRWLASLGLRHSFIAIDCWLAEIDPVPPGENSIIHQEVDPRAFILPFGLHPSSSREHTIYLRLGRKRPIALRLAISSKYRARFMGG